jgi:hypothetical protein
MIRHNDQRKGFALLLTLLVVTVVVSVTLAVIELTIKQLNLSVTARDSEVAFHAANAGMECSRYTRRMASSSLEAGDNSLSFNCFNQTQTLTRQGESLSTNGNGQLYRYSSQATWGTNDRCSVIEMVLMIVPDTETSDFEITNLNTIFSGVPVGETKSCSPGAKCTISQVVGYNKACANISSPGTVRREILLEF